MLGQDLRGPGASSDIVSYIDLAKLNVKHRYFVRPGQKNHRNLDSFFSTVIPGMAIDLSTIADQREVDDVSVFRVRPG